MDNDITITLTGSTALDYIRNDSIASSRVDSLLENIEDLMQERGLLEDNVVFLSDQLSDLRVQYTALEKKYNETVTPDIDYRIARDTDLARDVLQDIVPTTGLDNLTAVQTPKLKSRLSKQDKADLSKLANKNFTSDHRLDKFAKERNLRPQTVATHIKKHSEGGFTIVKGSDIKKGDYGFKFSVAKNALYFTTNDGRYHPVDK